MIVSYDHRAYGGPNGAMHEMTAAPAAQGGHLVTTMRHGAAPPVRRRVCSAMQIGQSVIVRTGGRAARLCYGPARRLANFAASHAIAGLLPVRLDCAVGAGGGGWTTGCSVYREERCWLVELVFRRTGGRAARSLCGPTRRRATPRGVACCRRRYLADVVGLRGWRTSHCVGAPGPLSTLAPHPFYDFALSVPGECSTYWVSAAVSARAPAFQWAVV